MISPEKWKLTVHMYTIAWALAQGPRAWAPGPGSKIYTNKKQKICVSGFHDFTEEMKIDSTKT